MTENFQTYQWVILDKILQNLKNPNPNNLTASYQGLTLFFSDSGFEIGFINSLKKDNR